MAAHKITLSQSNWTGTDAIYYDDVSGLFYADSDLLNDITFITQPTRDGWKFNGFFASSSTGSPGVQYITPQGGFTDEFYAKCVSLTGTTGLTIYVNGIQRAWKLTLSVNGGTSGSGTTELWYALDGTGFYDNHECAGDVVDRIVIPQCDGKIYKGQFNTTTGGTQYIDMDGLFLPAMNSLVLTAAKTIYAVWVIPVKVTVSANSGSGGTSSFYRDQLHGIWYADATFRLQINSIVPHVRECYALLGLMKTNSDTGVVVVKNDGTIDPAWEPTSNATIYARWSIVSYKCTIAGTGGVGGYQAIFYKIGTSPKEWHLDHTCTDDVVRSVVVPKRVGFSLRGIFSATSGGTEYITRSGQFTDALESLSITAAKTFSAQWKSVCNVTLNDNGGSGGIGMMYYDGMVDMYYSDQSLDTDVQSVPVPVRECYRFDGYWSATRGGTKYIEDDGSFTSEMTALAPTSAKTFYAQWTRISYKVTLDDAGGSGGTGQVYVNGTDAKLFADDLCTVEMSSVTMPAKTGYSAMGYYQTTSGGSKYIDADGIVLVSIVISSDVMIHMRWSANQYTITFDHDDGTVDTPSKTVTFGQKVGTLPSVTPPSDRKSFECWTVNGQEISDDTVWGWAEDVTANVKWRLVFGDVVDWFGLGSDWLVPEESECGDNRKRVCCAHIGKYDPGVTAMGPVWRNPSVTYRVVGDGTISVRLGKGFAGKIGGPTRIINTTGYMIANVSIHTAIGEFPTVTVSGTANEGFVYSGSEKIARATDAINSFVISIPIKAMAHAQSLGIFADSGAVSLHEVNVEFSADPVVVAEDMCPCASDIVNGRARASVSTVRISGSEAESKLVAANGWTKVDEMINYGGTDYTRTSSTFEKEL